MRVLILKVLEAAEENWRSSLSEK